MVKAAN